VKSSGKRGNQAEHGRRAPLRIGKKKKHVKNQGQHKVKRDGVKKEAQEENGGALGRQPLPREDNEDRRERAKEGKRRKRMPRGEDTNWPSFPRIKSPGESGGGTPGPDLKKREEKKGRRGGLRGKEEPAGSAQTAAECTAQQSGCLFGLVGG